MFEFPSLLGEVKAYQGGQISNASLRLNAKCPLLDAKCPFLDAKCLFCQDSVVFLGPAP